ncbi:hypothetical protein K440DRAFT_612151 [Wilcoxina mikolae CBS 423.85]|nr:hypothetical protein K440DRAFT_612151 [Wilcoxina mikolae CBS 423.85]
MANFSVSLWLFLFGVFPFSRCLLARSCYYYYYLLLTTLGRLCWCVFCDCDMGFGV